MKDLILISHGNLSKEFKSPDDFGDEFDKLTSNLGDYVVFADLLGGTPCNVVTNKILSNHLNIDIFTGMNMPMIVGYINSTMTNTSPQPLQNGKDGIAHVNEII